MDFATFIKKYYNKLNPKTGKNWTIPDVSADSGLGTTTVDEWITYAMKVQADTVKMFNRMPSDDEIVSAYNAAHGVVVTPPIVSTTPVPLPPRDPATTIATAYGRVQPAPKVAGLTLIGQYSPEQFEELMHHILCEHDELAAKQKALNAPKALTVSVATDYQQQSILTWPFQKVIELWDALAHKG